MEDFDVAGIEVSSESFLVRVVRHGRLGSPQTFPNTAEGRLAILRLLTRSGARVRVCLESTGLYGLDLALALHEKAVIEVMVANPRSVRHFGEAMMQRSKTDPLDAALLCEYAARMPFQRWQPPTLTARQLCAITRQIHALTVMSTMDKNRLHAANLSETTPKIVRDELERNLAAQKASIGRLTRAALKLIDTDPELKRRFALLVNGPQKAPGIAQTSALQILGELVLVGPDFNVHQWVAYAGLDPREYQSGKSVHKKVRISKVGNAHLRRALYMPALVAVRCNAYFRAFYQHLLAKGKLKMVALVAAMRKLLHALYAMMKYNQPFDGSKLFPNACPPLSEATRA